MTRSRTWDSSMAEIRARAHQGPVDAPRLRHPKAQRHRSGSTPRQCAPAQAPHCTAIPPRRYRPSKQGTSQHNGIAATARQRSSTRRRAARERYRHDNHTATATRPAAACLGSGTPQRSVTAAARTPHQRTAPQHAKGAARKTVQRLCKHQTGKKPRGTTCPRGRCGR